MIPVVILVGTSDSGKTTFMEKLIKVIKCRGYRVATIKHHHQEIEVDKPGKDTWRHANAGADKVVFATPKAVVTYEYPSNEKSLAKIIAEINNVDIIVVEGFKQEKYPKIEILRQEHRQKLISPSEDLVAVVTDLPKDFPVPSFSLDDAVGVVSLLEEQFITPKMR